MKTLIFLLILNIQLAYSSGGEGGGDRVGNGGDVLLCQEAGEDKYYVLDEYEADFKLEIGEKDIPYTNKVTILLNKIKASFPARYSAYLQIYANLKRRMTFADLPLPEIEDDQLYELNGCQKIQAAYFKKDAKGFYTYNLQRKIWHALDSDQKAVLLLHEILYTEAIGLRTMNSVSVRGAVRLLFKSGEFDAKAFDDHFLLPLKNTGTFGQNTDQLQNAYSERIAIDLLERNWTLHYSDPSIKSKLEVMRERFLSNPLICRYVTDHLRRIKELSNI
jgi:hypothetical protein